MSILDAIVCGLKADGQRNPAASSLGDAMRALADAADHETNRACVVTYELRRLAACAHALDGVAEAIAAVRAAREDEGLRRQVLRVRRGQADAERSWYVAME